MNTSKKKYSVAFLVIFVASQLMAAPMAGAAEKGYRYWGYFKAAPKATVWTSSMTGPTVDVTDGSVEGWTFTFSSDSIPDAKSPKIAPNFESLCAKTKPVAGKKRIGVVIDFGSAALRPNPLRLLPWLLILHCLMLLEKFRRNHFAWLNQFYYSATFLWC